jgi:hypothetical protein
VRLSIKQSRSLYAFTLRSCAQEGRTAGPSAALGMTKGEGSVHLSSCYKGLRELSAEREANDPSIHITNCRGRNKSTLCHPEQSRGICSSTPRCRKSKPKNRMWLVGLLERFHLGLIQVDFQRFDRLIQMSHLARPDDRCAYPRLRQYPCQSYL